MLWPDKEDEQARHLLNVAAYEIRKELGEEAVVSRGDDIFLDPLVIGSDVDDFAAALDREDYDAAIPLYRGPFLDGFFLGGSVDFEHWVDEQRNLYARRYAKALTERAEAVEATGDRAAAAEAWRKAANEERFDSRVALRLLRALDAAGNRAGALQFARIHEALLEEEFGTAPDPAFTAAVEEIRSGTAAAAPPPRPGPAEATAAAPAVAAGPAPSGRGDSAEGTEPGRLEGAPAADASSDAERRNGVGAEERRIPSILRGAGAWAAGVVALLVAVAAMATYVWGPTPARGSDEPLRVTVLPLQPSDPADEPFADGLSESILDALGQVDGITVPGWTAVVALRGVSADEAARRTVADYVVAGSVRRDPDSDSVRIRVELATRDGDAIWNEVYDRPTRRWRATWDEIARAVLDKMQVELSPTAASALGDPAGDTNDPEARDLFLRGRHAWFKRTPEGFQQALDYFGRAVQRDQGYAQAHAGLADVYNLMGAYDYGVLPPDQAFPRARQEAERALELAPQLAEAHAALASIRFGYDRDWEGAERAYREAIALKPHYAEAHHWYSLFLLAAGREDDAKQEVLRAVELDSLSPVFHASLGRHHYFVGDAAGALKAYRHALRIDAGFVTAHMAAGVALLELGRHDEAITYFDRGAALLGGTSMLAMALTANAHGRAGRPAEARAILMRLEGLRSDGRWIPPEWFALVHLGLGDHDAAITAFEAALQNRSNAAPLFGIDPLTRPLRDDPRFQRLIERGRQPVRRSDSG